MKNYPSLRAFASYAATFKRPFWTTAMVFALANAALAVLPLLIGQLTGSLSNNDGNINFWLWTVIGASLVHYILWTIGDYLYKNTLLERLHRYDDIVFKNIMAHDYSFFTERFTGKISSYATSLGQEFRDLTDTFMHSYSGMIVFMPIFIATMFSVNTYVGLLFALSVAMMLVGGKPLAIKDAAAERRLADEKSTLNGHTVDSISNFVAIKSFGNEAVEESQLYEKRNNLIGSSRYAYLRSIYFWTYMGTIVRVLLWTATFLLIIYEYIQGEISLAQVTTFVAAIMIYQNYVWEVVWNFSQLNIKFARIEEAHRYLFGNRNIVTDELPDGPLRLKKSDFKNSLELKGLHFAYPEKAEVSILKDVNVKIMAGEKIGVVGPSGGGKSTLMKLLLGYYPVEHGSLKIDGKSVQSSQLTDLLSFVPQDTALFHRTVSENISYAKPNASNGQIKEAAKHAQAHEFIQGLDRQYDTLVGERGVKLSGGQRQRIAIARALLKDAPILLLDEATSALDSESEQQIQSAFDELLIGRTAIVIAHRLSTIQRMDRILVIDKGRIVQQGTHVELLAKTGIYKKLWQHQSGGFIEE